MGAGNLPFSLPIVFEKPDTLPDRLLDESFYKSFQNYPHPDDHKIKNWSPIVGKEGVASIHSCSIAITRTLKSSVTRVHKSSNTGPSVLSHESRSPLTRAHQSSNASVAVLQHESISPLTRVHQSSITRDHKSSTTSPLVLLTRASNSQAK